MPEQGAFGSLGYASKPVFAGFLLSANCCPTGNHAILVLSISQDTRMYCPRCGTTNYYDSHRCSTCGEDLLGPYRPLEMSTVMSDADPVAWRNFPANVAKLTFSQHLRVLFFVWLHGVVVLTSVTLFWGLVWVPAVAYFRHSVLFFPPVEMIPRAVYGVIGAASGSAIVGWAYAMCCSNEQK